MQKPAQTKYEIHPLIRDRWSSVCFTNRRIEPKILASLFEAARWAPSSYNEQPWTFCLATQDQPAEFAALLGCLMETNQAWVKNAYGLAISAAKLHLDRNGKPNRFAFHDVGLATQNLILQAAHHGISCHLMGGFDVDKARAALAIPATHDPVAALAIGYPADDLSGFDAALQERERGVRSRKPLSGMVNTGTFGNPDSRV